MCMLRKDIVDRIPPIRTASGYPSMPGPLRPMKKDDGYDGGDHDDDIDDDDFEGDKDDDDDDEDDDDD